MTTIGDLERKAGIGRTAEERTAFWIRFGHLEAERVLRAGVAELNRMIAQKERQPTAPRLRSSVASSRQGPLPRLTSEQHDALAAYAAKHGRRWKSILNNAWMGGPPYDDGGILRGLRNSHGPSWLVSYRLRKPGGLIDPGTKVPDA